jgi:predicted hydrolase (HD superfamily)
MAWKSPRARAHARDEKITSARRKKTMMKLTRKERDKYLAKHCPKIYAAMKADAEAKAQPRLLR